MRTERLHGEPAQKPVKKKHHVGTIALVLVLAAAAAAGVRAYQAKSFPDGVTVNGVSVGGMTVSQAQGEIDSNANTIRIAKDQAEPVRVETVYRYDTKSPLRIRCALASIDPRNFLSKPADYTIALKAVDGIEKTAKKIENVFPLEEGMTRTEDAYINLDTMRIVKEVEGDSLDYQKLAEDIAAQREKEPSEDTFEFSSKDYIAAPAVRTADLQEELKFDKYYLSDGMKLKVAGSNSIELSPKQLSKVILYTENGPEYSEEGAQKIAEEIGSDFQKDWYTVETQEGDKTLINYVIDDEVDVQKTAESIINAAKEGKNGEVVVTSGEHDLSTRVEVSISSQKVYYVEKGEVKLTTSVVTGSSKNQTPRGIFELAYKERNATLTGPNGDGTNYASKVSYWMPFNGGIGLHDAPWRSSFGGSIYVSGGSHGCVNMPPSEAKKLYNMIDAGTLVYVYD